MYCMRCGSENPDDAKFCQSCAANLRRGGPAEAFSQLAGSVLFLVAISMFSANILLSIIIKVTGNRSLISQLYRLVNQYSGFLEYSGIDIYRYLEYLNLYTSSSFISALLSQTMPIVIAVGLWLIYANSRRNPAPTTGITMIWVVKIIGMVMDCLLIGFSVIVMIVVAIAVHSYSSEVAMGMWIILLFVAVIGTFLILFDWKMIKSIDAGRKAIRGDSSGRFSSFVIVMMYIGGAIYGSEILATRFDPFDFLGIVSGLLTAGTAFMFAIILHKSKKLVEAVNNGTYQGMAVNPAAYPYNGPSQYSQNPMKESAPAQLLKEERDNIEGKLPSGWESPDFKTVESEGSIFEYWPNVQNNEVGETCDLKTNPGDTVMLKEAEKLPTSYIYRVSTGITTPITKYPFYLGKGTGADMNLIENPAVSRKHAVISYENGTFYIEDTDSSNHTFVNGTMLLSRSMTPISHNDQICLGNEELIFLCN